VPILPGLPVRKQWFYGPLVGRPAPGHGYQPNGGDSFAIHNGPGVHNFILTSGMWWLRVGDRPRFHMEVRSGAGAYASPALLPDLGATAQFRLAITGGGKTKWLDEFSSIDAVLSPGSARWSCQDKELGLSVSLQVQPFLRPWGFAATVKAESPKQQPVQLTWNIARAIPAAEHEEYAEFTSGQYGRIFVGTVEKGSLARKGQISAGLNPAADGQLPSSRLLCVWGYGDYNKQGVAEAYKRLDFRPFDAAWLGGKSLPTTPRASLSYIS
jgi:hypothetical protein